MRRGFWSSPSKQFLVSGHAWNGRRRRVRGRFRRSRPTFPTRPEPVAITLPALVSIGFVRIAGDVCWKRTALYVCVPFLHRFQAEAPGVGSCFCEGAILPEVCCDAACPEPISIALPAFPLIGLVGGSWDISRKRPALCECDPLFGRF
jgi:hypothetical protein